MTRLISKGLISVATASVLMTSFTGCMDSTSTTGSETVTKQATGSVVGLVQDTNGNPISGVTVYLAGKEAKTDAGGSYRFDKVPVTNVAGADNNTGHAALSITIAAPTGYLGATVTVTPAAQIDDAESTGTGTATSGNTVTNGVETFIDGFLAQAGTAVLPALGSTVTGKLELQTSEAAVAGATVNLDFVSVGGVGANVAQTQNGVATTYATGEYSAVTDANGNFTITNVPNDSTLTYVVAGYTVNGIEVGGATTVVTNAEGVNAVGDLQVTPVVNEDSVAPMVTSIVGQIDGTQARVMMEDDVRQTFVINFSEPIDTLSEIDTDITNSVNVYSNTAKAYLAQTTTVTAANQITVVLDTPLGDNVSFDINLLQTDFKDAAGNFLGLNGAANVNYDSIPTTQFVRLALNSYNDLNENASAVTNAAQMTTDTSGTDMTVNNIDLQAASVAFNDVDDSDVAVIGQLNGADLAESQLTEARLDALADALTAGAVNVDTNVTRISFTPSGATNYTVRVTTSTDAARAGLQAIGTKKSSTIATITDDFGAADENATLVPVSTTSTANMEFVVQGVRAGDKVTITPTDDFGYAGTAQVVTLADNVAPTTVLQKSYLNGGATAGHNGGSTVVKYGDGGELADTSGVVTVGTPYLAINNSLLDSLTAAGAPVNDSNDGDESLEKELYKFNTQNTSGTAYISGKGTYDIVAWKAFNNDVNLTRAIGVAFSEDISLNGVTPSFNGTTTFSSFTVNNDVKTNIDANTSIDSDLIDQTTSNVLTLANTDDGKVLDYTGIADIAGNVAGADANAKVVIRDKMAPFVSKAEYNGEGLVITFNEAIQLNTTAPKTTLVIKAADGATTTATCDANEDTNGTWKLSNNNMTLTVLPGDFGDENMTIRTSTDWNLSTYPYSADEYGVGATTNVRHAYLDFSAVRDDNNNSWDNYATSVRATSAVAAPLFAVANTIGDFTVTANSTNFLVAATTTVADQTIVWTFAHPIRVATSGTDIFADADANNTDGTMDYTAAAKVNTWFNYVSDNNGTEYNLTGANLKATLSADKKQITLVFRTPYDANSTDCYVKEVSPNVVTSSWDTTKTANAFTANAQ